MAEGIPSRDVARKVFIRELYQGDREVSRVRVLGTVVSKFVSDTGSFGSLTLDDGTDTIQARAFSEDLDKIELIRPGDMVDIVGRVREYNGEEYIALEAAARIEDPNWELVRRLELYMRRDSIPGQLTPPPGGGEESIQVEEESVTEDKGLVVLGILEELDEGDGVSYSDLLARAAISEDELEEVLGDLMGRGDIYEPKIGRFKKV
ncbi:MAG: hypothetical protein GXO65_04285 [Euryarchaeota archaeon]|nr:hypothetical protein [Euryarchaeota archaeon]